MATFRVAHLTDLHFGRYLNWLNPTDAVEGAAEGFREAFRYLLQQKGKTAPSRIFYPSSFNPDAAVGILEWLADELPYLDAILVTGDLATTGDAGDLELARRFFGGQVPTEWSPLPQGIVVVDADIPLLTVPGNHDRYWGLAAQPGSPRFETFFGKYWDLNKGLSFPVAAPTHECGRVRLASLELDGSYLGIMCADLTLESATSATGLTGFFGQGRAAARIIDELVCGTMEAKRELQELRQPFGIIWAIHFPPSFPDVSEALSLLEADNLVSGAAACGVTHIIAGHTHAVLKYEVSSPSGPVTIICSGPSSGVSAHGRYSFSVLDIEVFDGGRTEIIPTAFSWQDFRFVQDDDFPIRT